MVSFILQFEVVCFLLLGQHVVSLAFTISFELRCTWLYGVLRLCSSDFHGFKENKLEMSLCFCQVPENLVLDRIPRSSASMR